MNLSSPYPYPAYSCIRKIPHPWERNQTHSDAVMDRRAFRINRGRNCSSPCRQQCNTGRWTRPL